MARYGRRESFEYRALWTSDIYQDLCIMANPRVSADKIANRSFLINDKGEVDRVGYSIDKSGEKKRIFKKATVFQFMKLYLHSLDLLYSIIKAFKNNFHK